MNLTSTDFSALIRLASSLPRRDKSRRAILAGLRMATDSDVGKIQRLIDSGNTEQAMVLAKSQDTWNPDDYEFPGWEFGAYRKRKPLLLDAAESRNFSGMDLTNVVISGFTNMRGANFSGCTISTNATKTDMGWTVLFSNPRTDKRDLTGCNFSNTKWSGDFTEYFQGVDLRIRGSKFDGAKFTYKNNGAGWFAYGDMRGCSFHNSIILGNDYAVEATNFSGCDMRGILIQNCVLHKTKFKGANLTGAKFDGCDWSGADFGNATLKDADFRNIRSRGYDLTPLDNPTVTRDRSAPNFKGADLTGAKFPEGFTPSF